MRAASERRAVAFTWPSTDVNAIRSAHLAARRVYRRPAPASLNLTLSAFTEQAFSVGVRRVDGWSERLLRLADESSADEREQLALTWTLAAVIQLDDAWEDLSHAVLRAPDVRSTRRRQVWKSDVARLAIMTGIEDWRLWVAACRNDARRAGADHG